MGERRGGDEGEGEGVREERGGEGMREERGGGGDEGGERRGRR